MRFPHIIVVLYLLVPTCQTVVNRIPLFRITVYPKLIQWIRAESLVSWIMKVYCVQYILVKLLLVHTIVSIKLIRFLLSENTSVWTMIVVFINKVILFYYFVPRTIFCNGCAISKWRRIFFMARVNVLEWRYLKQQ